VAKITTSDQSFDRQMEKILTAYITFLYNLSCSKNLLQWIRIWWLNALQTVVQNSWNCCICIKQEALLLQMDHATRLLVETLQLWNIPFEKGCNRQMTFKYMHPRSSQLLLLDRSYITSS